LQVLLHLRRQRSLQQLNVELVLTFHVFLTPL
jgi:hypothetical protein